MILSVCASHQMEKNPVERFLVMSNDIKRAYFYAPASRPIYVAIPDEDLCPGDEGKVACLNLSLYGTRDAAQNWSNAYSSHLESVGFTRGRASPCNFFHSERRISLTVHGDDFTSTGTERDLRWLDAQLKDKFEVKTKLLGPDAGRGHLQELRVLNRILAWTELGVTYEADQRHAEIIVRELGLEGAKAVMTPGSREDVEGQQKLNEKDNELLPPAEATRYRGLAARLNYLAQDRFELLYAAKECSRRM